MNRSIITAPCVGFVSLMVAAVGVFGCGGSRPPDSAPAAEGSKATSNANPASVRGDVPTQLKLKTADGWTIVGDLYRPESKALGTVVLLHQRGQSAQDWQSLGAMLQKAGLQAVALDQRGAGRSTQGPGPTGENAPWNTTGDIAAALQHFKTEGPFGLIGASYGANNALIYAATHPGQIHGVVLLSPGTNYHGLDALSPAKRYAGPLLIFHNSGDTVAGAGPKQIDAASASRDHTLRISEGTGHGVDLLDEKVNKEIVTFFVQRLRKTSP